MGVKFLLVALGGAIGSGARYGASLLGVRLFGPGFPVGTAFVNLVGCFFIGLLFALADEKGALGPESRLFFMTGLLGGLTTFSTFALETTNLLGDGSYGPFLLNFGLNNLGGLLLVILGAWIGRVI